MPGAGRVGVSTRTLPRRGVKFILPLLLSALYRSSLAASSNLGASSLQWAHHGAAASRFQCGSDGTN